MENIEKIKPSGIFTNYIYKAIPLAFDESMSYYETLCGLLSYLKDTVIPTVNNNADAIIEVQTLMQNLQNYVDNYFDNLDVQEEINNKLDKMAQDGTLAKIISEYLNSKAIFGFDTVSDMQSATNLINGSYARTCGKTSFNDGKSALYKIRTITNDDVVDGENIIEMLTDNTLVAEKIKNYNNRTIFIGDSYGLGTTNTSETIPSWIDYIVSKLDLSNNEYYRYSEGGSGFVATGTAGHTFQTLLSSNIDNISDKLTISRIICCGGFNDRGTNSILAIQSFISYCKTNFPNAKVYIGMIGNTSQMDSTGTSYRYNLYNVCLTSYKKANDYGAIYLTNVEYALKDYSYMSTDYQHPNEKGYKSIANFIYGALNGNPLDFYSMQDTATYTLPSNATDGSVSANIQRQGMMTNFQIEGNLSFTAQTLNTNALQLGKIVSKYFRNTNLANTYIVGNYKCKDSSNKSYFGIGTIEIASDATMTLRMKPELIANFNYIEFKFHGGIQTIAC